jgi:cation transport regulator
MEDGNMPYSTIDDLPANVKNHLPKHALEIYLSAFNNAWDEYKSPEKRRTGDTQETVAHRVAWTAVKKTYHKDPETGKWMKYT